MSYDLFTAAASAPQQQKDGSTSSELTLTLDLNSPRLAEYLGEASFYDEQVVADLVKTIPETKEYLLQHLGDKALAPGSKTGAKKGSVSRVDRVLGAGPDPAAREPEQQPGDLELEARLESLARASVAASDGSRYSTSMASKNGGRFDIVTTWSQWLMNKSLSVAYSFDYTRWDLTMADSAAGYDISATLDPSTTILDVTSQQQAFFLTRFADGLAVPGPHTCTLRSSATGKSMQFDTAGWKWGWAAPIATSLLTAGSDEWNKVKQNLEIPAGANNGNYRITKIYFDLEQAKISPDRSHSNVGNVPLEFMESLAKVQDAWRVFARNSNHHVLGYAVVSTVANEAHLGTFPPTAVRFQNYAYLTKETPNPTSSADKHGESNMLQILYKTGQQPFPDNPVLPWTGNWANPTLSGDDSTLGSMAISNKLFLDAFVIPRLAVFNRASHLEAFNPEVSHAGGIDWRYRYKWGPGSHADDVFHWQAPSSAVLALLTSYYGPGRAWAWSRSSSKSASKQVNGAGRFTANHSTTTTNILFVAQASNRIRMIHSNTHRLDASHRWIWTDTSKATITRTLEIDLTMKDLLQGRLGMEMPADPDVKVRVTDRSGTWLGENFVAPIANSIAGSLKNETTIRAAVTAINSRLSGRQVFVLPGGGHLFLKNPLFNADGDLLVTLDFNGEQQRAAPADDGN